MKAAIDDRSSGGAHFDISLCIDGVQTPWPVQIAIQWPMNNETNLKFHGRTWTKPMKARPRMK